MLDKKPKESGSRSGMKPIVNSAWPTTRPFTSEVVAGVAYNAYQYSQYFIKMLTRKKILVSNED